MKSLIIGLLAVTLTACGTPNPQTQSFSSEDDAKNVESNVNDTMISVSNPYIDSIPFIKLQMNPETAYITMADSIIPEITDSTIALCVEAAFTGELLKEFKTTNVAGDYIIDGVFHRGYKCKANTGFLYADKSIFTISSSEHRSEWMEKAQNNRGSLFQQILIVQNGRSVYSGKPIKPLTPNIYRSACIMNDGNFAVIQSLQSLPLQEFINSLIKMGVSDALYLDMGSGWNYGWYRETLDAPANCLFDYRTLYQTNWLLIKAKK